MGYESQKTLFITYRNGIDGTTPKDFNLTASAYAIIKDKDGKIKGDGSITLTAHKMNVTGNVSWYTKTGNTETQIKIPNTNNNYIGDTYTTTSPGTYIAKILSGSTVLYQDSVTITEVQDGQTGKSAISITLSNPTMTFNTSTANESETCEVMVYEGGTKLTYGSGNGQFQVYQGKLTSTTGQTSLGSEVITIADKDSNGSQTYTVFGKTTQGDNFRQELTIYWTVVRNGSNGSNGTSPYSISLDNDSDTLVISSADGQWISSGCVVNAKKYYGSSVQTYGYLNWSLETTSDEWVLDDGTVNDWNYQITTANPGSSEAILKIRTKNDSGVSVLKNITEATFVATWKSASNGGTTYATKKFSVKVLSSLSDYDLIVPQTVYNRKNIITTEGKETKVLVSVQKKSASGTESLEYGNSTICPVRIYKKTSTGYTDVGDWSVGISFSDDTGMHLVLGSAATTGNVPKIIWDEEVIEVVEDGAQGLSGLVLSLDNDSDIFVKKKDGTKISSDILVTARLTRDGKTESGVTFTLSSYPEAFKLGTSFNTNYVEFKGATGVLTIKDIPSGFESGDFVIKASGLNLEKTFTLRAVQSNADYDLCFDKTLINNTTSNGSVTVWVNKTNEDGVVTRLDAPEVFGSGTTSEKTLNIYYGSSNTLLSPNSTTGKWPTIPYTAGTKVSIPVKLVLENSEPNNTTAFSFEWDNETIEFVQNGAAAQDFSVTASAYTFVESTTSPVNEITLKASKKNLLGTQTVYWYKDDGTTPIRQSDSLTIYRTAQTDTSLPYGPGTYRAQIGTSTNPTWKDSLTIGLVSDGATGPNGKPAISISLSNPTMVFNSKNTTEKEECKVIVYEGATKLTPGTNTEKTFSIEKDTSDTQSVISNDTITITSPGAITKNYTVKVRPTGWKSGDSTQESTISINCTLVDDGEDGVYTSLQADPTVIHSTDLNKETNYITFTAYEKVGGKETKSLKLTSEYSYKYKWDSQSYTTVSFTSESSEFQINATHSGSPKTLKVELYKSNVFIASQTVEVLYDVVRREYFLYHDATTNAAPELPTEPDWRNFRENREDDENDTTKHKGWYQTQDEKYSYYYISKRNAYDELEQADKPWFGPMEIKQTPLTYNSWWEALDQATSGDKTKGIYSLEKDGVHAVGINADFIKTGAMKIATLDSETLEPVGDPVFETGWLDNKPYVKICNVEFTSAPMSSSNDSGSYQWSFDAINGISMSQDNSKIFSIGSSGLQMNGNGTFTGTINANAGTIGGVAIENYPTKKEIIRKNLLVGTSTGEGWTYNGTEKTFNSATKEFILTNSTTSEKYLYSFPVFLQKDKKYTLSFEAKHSGIAISNTSLNYPTIDIYALLNKSASKIAWKKENLELTDEYTKYSLTIIPNTGISDDDYGQHCYFRFDNNGKTASATLGTLYIKNIKLEEGCGAYTTNTGGNIVTDDASEYASEWSAAPEDSNGNLFQAELFSPIGTQSYTKLQDKCGWNLIHNTTGPACGIKISEEFLEENKEYVLSYSLKKTSGTLNKLGGHSTWYNTTKFLINGIDYSLSNGAAGTDSVLNNTNTHTVEWHFTKKSSASDTDKNLYIQVNRNSTTTAIAFDIWNIKLEEGDVASPWSQGNAGGIVDVSGNYSWKFSPSTGLYMWKGEQVNNDPIFKIDSNGLYMSGNGTFTGKITAESGNIAGWNIRPTSLIGVSKDSNNNEYTTALFTAFQGIPKFGEQDGEIDTTISPSVGGHSEKNWRILIGRRTKEAPDAFSFGVNSSGEIYTNEGQIGPFLLSNDGFAYDGTGSNATNFSIKNDGFKLQQNNTSLEFSGSGFKATNSAAKYSSYLNYDGFSLRKYATSNDEKDADSSISFGENGINFTSTVRDQYANEYTADGYILFEHKYLAGIGVSSDLHFKFGDTTVALSDLKNLTENLIYVYPRYGSSKKTYIVDCAEAGTTRITRRLEFYVENDVLKNITFKIYEDNNWKDWQL